MKMLDIYKMTIRESQELCDKVIKEGKELGKKWNSDTYRNNTIIDYRGDVYQIDFILGIVDVNDTAKELVF